MYQYKMLVSVGAIAVVTAGCMSKVPSNKVASESIESGAKTSVESLLFDQKTYFLENRAFTTSVKDLKTGLLTETQSYQYKLAPQPNKYKGVAIKATSKKSNLRSFTGVVFVVKSGKEQVTLSQVCETVNPSKVAPTAPTNPKKASDKIECPSGSRSSFEVATKQGQQLSVLFTPNP
ncbi:MAG: hypothetical protein HC866_04860 [Leptolyngbyaceae cyanobacterium RU_5_1]|nr:hypothetical protein [Leptolyngbyaceae cyanobacterium RU_5_1]